MLFRSEKAAWLCGLYRIEDGIPYFVILTKDAAGALKSIHDRMPLILPSASIDSWIDPESDPMGLMKMTINNVVYEKAE